MSCDYGAHNTEPQLGNLTSMQRYIIPYTVYYTHAYSVHGNKVAAAAAASDSESRLVVCETSNKVISKLKPIIPKRYCRRARSDNRSYTYLMQTHAARS